MKGASHIPETPRRAESASLAMKPMKAIRVHHHGRPDVLAYEDIDIRQPGPGEVRVRNRAIGVNFVDTRVVNGERVQVWSEDGRLFGLPGATIRAGQRSLR